MMPLIGTANLREADRNRPRVLQALLGSMTPLCTAKQRHVQCILLTRLHSRSSVGAVAGGGLCSCVVAVGALAAFATPTKESLGGAAKSPSETAATRQMSNGAS